MLQIARRAAQPLVDFLEVEGAQAGPEQAQAHEHSHVADPVDDERLVGRVAVDFSSYQKPISRYEQTPTSSQKMKIMKTLDEATRPSIEKQKSDR